MVGWIIVSDLVRERETRDKVPMSRCFPFPPPGYEKKKISTEEADSLIKEKQKREKKHKKEKKDKETSKDKYKEGKQRKDKHRDSKEKSRTSQDKKAVGVLPNTVQNNGNEESKFVQDLARRISNEEEARESQSVRKCSFPCGVREKKSENAVHPVSSCRDQKGTEIKEHAKKAELQEKNHRTTKGYKSLDNKEIKKSEPKYTTHRTSQDTKEEAINKSKPKNVEGGSILKERDVDTRNFGKRKNHETNGFIYENGSKLNKIHKPVASPVSSVENGSKFGACQTPPKPVTELLGTVCNPEHRINGIIDPQESKSRPEISSVKLKENGEGSVKKRPHSDLKYLDQILNVPKREELHEVDESEEQEWLFGKSGVKLSKKPKTDSTTSLDETLQVWNQAFRIESADTVALPYVVPF
ncbi:unnamed protein product [Eruca vesicaria subsp. sativa]|uniref:Uncharacterized protein n=1 Tax=Eruca vesicaria subsp. sativa TaxID=29727 RepID=A0ABC8IQ48_ERUVS|nr:unnamed protein product [Eruca vesicaria subsp. sativa]